MTLQTIKCPGGKTSQSGAAVALRYQHALIEDCGSIAGVRDKVLVEQGHYVIPVWNSHQGEIAHANYIWDHIETSKIMISDLWAKSINFWFIARKNSPVVHNKIGSVRVAVTQCSNFLAQQGKEFMPYNLTTDAYHAYLTGAELDGVLVSPNNDTDNSIFDVISKQTANDNNFTSFVTFADVAQTPLNLNPVSWLTGVKMKSLGATIGETEATFFSNLIGSVNNLNEIAKLVFVFKREGKVGLLFEGQPFYKNDLFDVEESNSGNVEIFEEAGALDRHYSEELSTLFGSEFNVLTTDDFILHSGVSSYLFICPHLGLYTHGYEIETVEPLVRFYISELFGRWDNGATCTVAQQEFFKRHETAWRERGSDFIVFTTVLT